MDQLEVSRTTRVSLAGRAGELVSAVWRERLARGDFVRRACGRSIEETMLQAHSPTMTVSTSATRTTFKITIPAMSLSPLDGV
jgi:hypothetical protein